MIHAFLPVELPPGGHESHPPLVRSFVILTCSVDLVNRIIKQWDEKAGSDTAFERARDPVPGSLSGDRNRRRSPNVSGAWRRGEEMHDYVVVGAGSAGCTIAARLSELPDANVLLLEAGPPDTNPYIHVPVGFYKMTDGPLTWGYQTAPQRGANQRTIAYPQGRVLGGGSSINAMVYTRGNPGDYDAWADDAGCKGWAFRDVLPYFIKAEDNQSFHNEFHGTGDRSAFPTRSVRIRYPGPFCWRRSSSEFPTIPISTATASPVAGSTKSLNGTAVAPAPRSATSPKPGGGPI